MLISEHIKPNLREFKRDSVSESLTQELLLSKDLDTARKEFDKFSGLKESEVTSKIALVESSLKKTEDLLKSHC